MTRWIAFLPLIALVALGVLFAGYALHHDPHVEPMATVGKPMPDLTLNGLDDAKPVRLHDTLKSGPVLVNFFASWCAPCAEDQPALLYLQQKGVRIVGVDYEDTPPRGSAANAQTFLSKLGDPFAQSVTDPDGRAGIEFGITGVPETFLVAADGRILSKHVGPLDKAAADELAAQVLTAR